MSFRDLVLLRKRGEVRLLERAEVLRDIVRRLGEEVVQGEDEEGRWEGKSSENAVPGDDGAGGSCDADVEDARGEGLVGGN